MSSEAAPRAPLSNGYANYVLGVLTLMYMFNYLDRWVLSILLVDIQKEFGDFAFLAQQLEHFLHARAQRQCVENFLQLLA